MTQPHEAAPVHDCLPLALLVDQDADTRRLYATYLREATCEIDEAEDGREALAKAIARPPRVIVPETRLPGIDGFELCRILRRDEKTRTIPVVFVTGDACNREIAPAAADCADAVLVKPCLPERLAAEIRRILALSGDLRRRGRAIRERADEQLSRSDDLLERSRAGIRRAIASRAFQRHCTTEPAEPPPLLICPACAALLRYLKSHVGGVSARHAEPWDYFECSAGCGAFQYRQRTRKLRRVV